MTQPELPTDSRKPIPLDYAPARKRSTGEQVARGCLIAFLIVLGVAVMALGLCYVRLNGF